MKKLESKPPVSLSLEPYTLPNVLFILLSLLWLTDFDTNLNTLNAMVENTVAFFYPDDSSTIAQAPQILDGLPTQSCEVILTNMKQSASLTLGILMSLYPRADLDAVGEGFAASCTEEEASKLVEDSTLMAECIVEMLSVDMS
jgi:hypothetical protein